MLASFRSLDLRFLGGGEINFKKSLERPLVYRSAFFFLTEAIAALLGVISGYAIEARSVEKKFHWSHTDPRILTFVLTAVCVVSSIVLLTLCLLWLRSDCYRTWNCERVIMVALSCQVAIIPFTSNWCAPLLWGMDPDEVWSGDPRIAEGRIVLAIDGFVTAACLFLPIRSCSMCFVTLCAWGSFTVLTVVVGSPFEGNSVMLPGELGVLCLFSFWGAREKEKNVREKWIAVRDMEDTAEELEEMREIVKDQEAELRREAMLIVESQPIGQSSSVDEEFDFIPKAYIGDTPLEYTRLKGQVMSLQIALRSWHVPQAHSQCCRFHTVLDSLHRTMRTMSKFPCKPQWSIFQGWQCIYCKCISADVCTRCPICATERFPMESTSSGSGSAGRVGNVISEDTSTTSGSVEEALVQPVGKLCVDGTANDASSTASGSSGRGLHKRGRTSSKEGRSPVPSVGRASPELEVPEVGTHQRL